MTSFRERRFESRHDKPKGNLRYLIILIFLFALAIWILSVDLENTSWLQWMTESTIPDQKNELVDQKYFDGNATCGYSAALDHPIWVGTSIDSSVQAIRVPGNGSRFFIHKHMIHADYDSTLFNFSFCINNGALPVVEEILDQADYWVEEWGELAMVAGIIETGNEIMNAGQTYCPDSLFFAFMQVRQEPPVTLGFIFSNGWTEQTLVDLAVPVNQIEAITGIGLFNDVLSEAVSDKIESERSVLTWGYKDDLYQKRLESRRNSYE